MSISEPQESDLLVPFETANIPEKYKEYYQIRRGNLFASIQRFSEMWKYYIDLDTIWMQEFGDLRSSLDANRIFPLMLYINGHAKIRISIELLSPGAWQKHAPFCAMPWNSLLTPTR